MTVETRVAPVDAILETHHDYYRVAGEFVLRSADCNGNNDLIGAKLYMDLAQNIYARGHEINPLFNIDQPKDLGE